MLDELLAELDELDVLDEELEELLDELDDGLDRLPDEEPMGFSSPPPHACRHSKVKDHKKNAAIFLIGMLISIVLYIRIYAHGSRYRLVAVIFMLR